MRDAPELVDVLTKLRASNPVAWNELHAVVSGFREAHVTSLINAADFGAMKLVQGELAATDKFLRALNKAKRPNIKG